MSRQATETVPFRKVLVVLSPDLVEPSDPMQSPLVLRALELARTTGCSLEFFHVCHDSSFDWALLASQHDVRAEKQRIIDDDATLMSEFMVRLDTGGLDAAHEVRWDPSRADAIMDKVADCGADLIMKQSRDHSYVLGIFDHTDWTLLRNSPVPVWFVKDGDHQPLSSIMCAVGTNPEHEEAFHPVDYDVMRTAGHLKELFKARRWVVHSFEVPVNMHAYANYEPMMAPVSSRVPLETHTEQRKRLAQVHGESIREFAEFFSVGDDSILIREGHPRRVLPGAVEDKNVGLLVMGAQDKGYWERLFSSVSAEPVLAKAHCDVLCMRFADREEESVYKAPAGKPKFDLERAIVSPADEFRDPLQVLEMDHVSDDLKRRILQSWQLDNDMVLKDVSEGGQSSEQGERLQEQLLRALAALEHKPEPKRASFS